MNHHIILLKRTCELICAWERLASVLRRKLKQLGNCNLVFVEYINIVCVILYIFIWFRVYKDDCHAYGLWTSSTASGNPSVDYWLLIVWMNLYVLEASSYLALIIHLSSIIVKKNWLYRYQHYCYFLWFSEKYVVCNGFQC